MNVAITGSTGLIGSALVPRLRADGHQVIRIVRRAAGDDEIQWNPTLGTIERRKLEGIDAVVHLAGAGVGDRRWTTDYKQLILSSRIDGTATLVKALALLATPPSVLLSASAVGYYGIREDELLTEYSQAGTGFLADVCARWEASASAASTSGIRVVNLRTGVVLSAAGGALKKQLWPFRLGIGARLGAGDHQFSWISRRDAVDAIAFLMANTALAGPFNVTSPDPVTNAAFTRALGRALHRPAILAVPEPILRAAFGTEMTSEFLFASQRVLPQRLLDSGFTFADRTLSDGLVTALHDRTSAG